MVSPGSNTGRSPGLSIIVHVKIANSGMDDQAVAHVMMFMTYLRSNFFVCFCYDQCAGYDLMTSHVIGGSFVWREVQNSNPR